MVAMPDPMHDTPPLFDRVLLTNDDGIDAPGLQVLQDVAASLAREVWTVAPAHDQSGTSHSLSLHSPLRVEARGERCFAVQGTPGDCVVMAARHLMRDAPPDMVLSGINRGANLGVETVFSGTVGAAMTALLLGFPSIALSQAFSDAASVPWNTARTLAPGVIRRVSALEWSGSACLNVNFPACAADRAGPIVLTRQGAGVLAGMDVLPGRDPRNIDFYWLRFQRDDRDDLADSESVAVRAGKIAVTPLRFERTDDETLERMRRGLG